MSETENTPVSAEEPTKSNGNGVKRRKAPEKMAADFSFEVRTATVTLKGSTLSWSKEIPRCPPRGDQTAHEQEHWRERFHTFNGKVAIPAMALRKAMEEAMKGTKIPGKGSATYAGVFRTGIVPVEEFGVTNVAVGDLQEDWQFVPGSPGKGKPGTGTRVHKCFPLVSSWGATFKFVLYDDQIDQAMLTAALKIAGIRVGVGRFRPANGGFHGRFAVTSVVIVKADIDGLTPPTGPAQAPPLVAEHEPLVEKNRELQTARANGAQI